MPAEALHQGRRPHGSSTGASATAWRLLPLTAFAVTAALLVAVGALVGQAPWSRSPVVVGDFGNQSLPFLAYYRDVLTGHANGDLLWSWGMSYGQSFWGTWAQYLACPTNLVVLLFPRSMVAAAAFTAHLLTGALAAAAMAALLRRMHRGPLLVALALAVAWGANPYSLLDSSYHPYWTVGSVALPLVVLGACWVRDRSPWAAAVAPVVGLLMIANFYTAYMAVLGAAVIVLAWMLAAPAQWPDPLRTLVRWALLGALGVAMSAVVVVPTYLAVRRSAETPEVPFDRGHLLDWAAAVLPGADTIGRAPSWSLGVVPLVLLGAVALRARPRRTLVWAGAVLVLLVSLALRPTALLWHGGDVPDGNFFREAWVVAGTMLVATWHLLGDRAGAAGASRRGAALVGAGATATAVVVLSVVAASRSDEVSGLGAAAGALLAAATALVVVAVVSRGARPGHATGGLLLCLVLVEVLVAAPGGALRFRDRVHEQTVDYAGYAAEAGQVAGRLDRGHGTTAGAHVGAHLTTNDPLLLGGVGATGYTTMMPLDVARTTVRLGARSGAAGRRLYTTGSDLERALYGTDDAPGRSQARWVDAPRAQGGDARGSLWPQVLADGLLRDVHQASGRAVEGGTTYTCPASDPRVTVDTVGATGSVELGGVSHPVVPTGRWQGRTWSVDRPADGRVTHLGGGAVRVYCHGAQVAQGGLPAALHRDGHAFTAAAPSSTGADLLVATTYTSEWSCTSGGHRADTYAREGLLGVRHPGGAVSCTFHPDGMTAGEGTSGAAALLWAVGTGALTVRRRRGHREVS